MLCPKCHNPLLASSSKGRSKYYSYYHCISPCDTRYKKEDVDTWFQGFLSSISLNKNAQTLLSKMVEERFKTQTKSHILGPKHYEQANNLEQKLIKLQDLFIDGELDRNEFHQAKNRYENLLNELKEKEEAQKKKSEILKIYKQGFKKLESIDLQFIESDIENKRRLLGSMFPEKFQFEKNEVRTADINPLLLKISSINKGLQRNKKRDKSNNNDLSRHVLKTGLEPVRP
ncbi:hypothetical protein [Yeosuana marina]|uniref:hypothetical protein n=1 Tax=Yeosuana marina TaxID=1565536 RepID=UPI0030C8CC3A